MKDYRIFITFPANTFNQNLYFCVKKTNTMKKSIAGLLMLGFGVVTSGAAQSVKIGYVRSNYILSLMPEAQAAQRDIDAFERKLSNRLNAMRQGLAMQSAQLEQESANLSDSIKAERQKELQLLQQDILKEQQTAQGQLQFKSIQSISPLERKVQQTIDSVAQADGYTHVFEATINERPVFIYSENPTEANMTPLVIEALGLTIPADTTGR